MRKQTNKVQGLTTKFEEEKTIHDLHRDREELFSNYEQETTSTSVGLVFGYLRRRIMRAPAADMYVGAVFGAAFRLAKESYDDVLILSALHGVLAPTDVIESYEMCFNEMLYSEKAGWADQVVSTLFVLYPMTRLHLVLFASEDISDHIVNSAYGQGQGGYWDFEFPIRGMDLYDQVDWLKRREYDAFESLIP